MDYLQTIRVKLGFIAVAEKLLTKEQVANINLMQSTMDKRFGDIAVSNGDLTQEQVQYLLNLQGNPYLQFIQAVTDLGYLTLEDIENHLEQYQVEKQYSLEDMEAIKSGDIDRIADVMIHITNENVDELARLTLRNINRFICTNFNFHKVNFLKKIEIRKMAYQWVTGDVNWFLGFEAEEEGLLTISNLYANEVFERLEDEAKDSVQEFINCINGLFATKLSQQELCIDLMPPEYCENTTVESEKNIFVIPIVINNKETNIVIAMDTNINIQN